MASRKPSSIVIVTDNKEDISSDLKNLTKDESNLNDDKRDPLIRVEYTLTTADLEELKDAFESEAKKYPDGSFKLKKHEFAVFLLKSLKKGSLQEYEELFENIDVTKTGFVDWDKFTSYMLLMLYETDDRTKAYSIPNWKAEKNIQNGHREIIRRVQYVKNINSYISISKEGICCTFDNDMKFLNQYKISSGSCKARDLWVTDFVVMLNVNKLAVSFTTKEIEIYDCSKLDFTCQFRIINISYTPLCLDYWFNTQDDNDAILVWGDTNGLVHSIHFNSAKIALFERPSNESNENEKQEICLKVNINEIKDRYKNATYFAYEAHPGWVRKVKWIRSLDCIISCSATDRESINLGWFEKTNAKTRTPYFKLDLKVDSGKRDNDYYSSSTLLKTQTSNEQNYETNSDIYCKSEENLVINESRKTFCKPVNEKQLNEKQDKENKRDSRKSQISVSKGGVNSFDFDEKLNLIATANANNDVNLYNPYVQEANGVLKGHLNSVLSVCFISSRNQLLSFSKDKVLRIWNVHLQMCIQRLATHFPKGPEVEMFCWFDTTFNRIFTIIKNNILMLEMKVEVKDRVMTHSKPVVAAKLNKVNDQVISLSQDGTLTMWQIENGQKFKTLTDLHGLSEVTCMEFDETNTKFYTASTDGIIKIWDFNGHCYHTLDANDGQSCEITQMLTLKRRIIAVGWKKQITTFRNNMFKDHKVKSNEWKGRQEHDDDIICTTVQKQQPLILATGSFDGDIVLWNSVTELPIKHLTERKRKAPKAPTIKTENSFTSENRARKMSRVLSKRHNRPEPALIDPDNDFSNAITCLRFLQTRICTRDANLVSCGGNGWCRFWDASGGRLVGEFQAHLQASSIILDIEKDENYLVTADVNGNLRVWNIMDYCRNINQDNTLIKTSPPLVADIKAHTDVINSIDFCYKQSGIQIITASSDCSVALYDILGTKIGVFGQDEHWKLDSFNIRKKSLIQELQVEEQQETKTKKQEENQSEEIFNETETNYDQIPTSQKNDKMVTRLNRDFQLELTFNYDNDAFIKDPSLRYNPWSKTILGRAYQEARVSKRARRQPGLLQTEEYLNWEKTGQTPGGLYGALKTSDLSSLADIKEPYKPEFVTHPHRFFRDRNKQKSEISLPNLAETLNSAFDEKALFPKYILDYEARMRQEHKKILDNATGVDGSSYGKK